jgi:hypothetical protein
MNGAGLTPDEIKQRFDEKTIREATTFQTQGISDQAAKAYLETEQGDLYLKKRA